MSILDSLTDLQESDETVWSTPDVSITIETRTESDEIVHREYTFNHAPEWDKWVFSELVEKRADADDRVSDRSWDKSRHVTWDESETRNIDVPPEVTKELEAILDVDTVTFQQP